MSAYQQYLRQLEQQNGLPPGLLAVQQQAESNFDPNAVSPAGAQGIAQFMPATAAEYGIDPFDPMQAAQAQAKMMGSLLKKYQGDVPSALAGYNWGQGNVDRKGLDNAPAETRGYIAKIMGGMQQPDTITAEVNLQTPVSSGLNLSEMSDADLMAMAQQHGLKVEQQPAKPDLSKLSDAELLALANQHGIAIDDGYTLGGDISSIPGKALAGIGEGALRTAANTTGGIAKAIAEGLQASGIAPEFGADQQSQIGNYLRQINADAPRFSNTNSLGDAAKLAGSALAAVPFFMASPAGMVAAGGIGGGADAYEKTKGDALATAAGAALGAGVNAIPAAMLGAGQGIAKSALGSAAFGAATPDIMQIPERLAGQTPAPITGTERLDSAVNSAILGGALGRVGARPEVKSEPLSQQAIKDVAQTAYKQAEALGGSFKPEFTDKLVNTAESMLPRDAKVAGMEVYKPLRDAAAEIKRFQGEPMTLERVQALDEALSMMIDGHTELGKVKKSGYPLVELQDKFRDMVESYGNDAKQGGEGFQALKDGRELWAAQMRQNDIERILTRAESMDSPAQGIKSGMRTLMMNPKRFGRYSKPEQAAIKRASQTGVAGEVMRLLGSRLVPIIAGGTGLAAGGGIGAAAAAYGVSTAARAGAAKLQKNRVDAVSKAINAPLAETIRRVNERQNIISKQAPSEKVAKPVAQPEPPPPAAPAVAKPQPIPMKAPTKVAPVVMQSMAKQTMPIKTAPQKAAPLPRTGIGAKEPTSLAAFVRANGGLKDIGGDVLAMVGTKATRLLRPNKGKSLDEMALRAWERGYFPEKGTERPSINDFLDKLAEDVNGKPQYSDKDVKAVQKFNDAMSRNSEIDRMVNEYNIDTNGKTETQIINEILDLRSQEEALALTKEIADSMMKDMQEAKEKAKQFLESKGDAWEPDAFDDSLEIGEPNGRYEKIYE